MEKSSKRSVLITGCSDGGVGAALAKEFHKHGLHVYATARDVSKMQDLKDLGIETLRLDIQSDASIQECASKIESLDILINNAGGMYTMPIADLDIAEAKKMFDLNVWGNIQLTQTFLPLLLKSPKAMVVNHTSTGADISIPFQSVYNASKAAMSRFSQIMRLELQAFDITVIELKTGGVKTNIMNNLQAKSPTLPENSIYAPAKDVLNTSLRVEWFGSMGIPAEQWAREVVADLLKPSPPPVIWRGESAFLSRIAGYFPFGWFDNRLKQMTSADKVEEIMLKARS